MFPHLYFPVAYFPNLMFPSGETTLSVPRPVPHDERAANRRSREHEQRVAEIFNSFIFGGTLRMTGQADYVLGYTPTTLADWPAPAPQTIWEALDDLAEWSMSGGGGAPVTITEAAIASPIPVTPRGLQGTPDSPYQIIADGSALTYHGPIYKLTKPVNGDFSWVNQGGATVVTTNGGIYITAPVDGASGPNFRIRTKTAPATPYTLTVLLQADLYPADFLMVAIGFRESGTGKLEVLEQVYSAAGGGFVLAVENYAGPTTFHATRAFFNISNIGLPIWMRLVADGTNISFQWSTSGFGFQTIAQVAKNNYFTTGPDQIFFAAATTNATYQAKGHLISWKQE